MPDEETVNIVLKRMLERFLKVPPFKKLEFQSQKKSLWNLYKKKISNQKLNQWLKTYEINFINKKTNKEKVLNFALKLDRSWKAKKAPKRSSEYLNFMAKFVA